MSNPPSRESWYYVFDRVYLEFQGTLRRAAARWLAPELRRRVDEDDILQSVFRTFYCRNADGLCKFDHTGALRNYLWTITAHKVYKHSRRHRALIWQPWHGAWRANRRPQHSGNRRRWGHLLAERLREVWWHRLHRSQSASG